MKQHKPKGWSNEDIEFAVEYCDKYGKMHVGIDEGKIFQVSLVKWISWGRWAHLVLYAALPGVTRTNLREFFIERYAADRMVFSYCRKDRLKAIRVASVREIRDPEDVTKVTLEYEIESKDITGTIPGELVTGAWPQHAAGDQTERAFGS